MFQEKLKVSKKFTMNLDTANETLQNIFEACEQTPNSVPLPTLISHKVVLVRPITVMIYVCIAILFFLLLLPFFMSQPHYKFVSFTNYDSFYVKEHYAEQDRVVIRVNDNQIDLSRCYIVDANGITRPASFFHPETGTITFPFTSGPADIYVSDLHQHTLHLLLTSQ